MKKLTKVQLVSLVSLFILFATATFTHARAYPVRPVEKGEPISSPKNPVHPLGKVKGEKPITPPVSGLQK